MRWVAMRETPHPKPEIFGRKKAHNALRRWDGGRAITICMRRAVGITPSQRPASIRKI